MSLPDNTFTIFFSKQLSILPQRTSSRKRSNGNGNGLDNLHVSTSASRPIYLGNLCGESRETTEPPSPSLRAQHMRMTKQETIKISNNLMAVIFLTCGNDADDALFGGYSNTKPLPSLICPVLSYEHVLKNANEELFMASRNCKCFVCEWEFLLNRLIRD